MKLLTSDQLQEWLGISRPTVYQWVREGKLHPVRAGRNLLFEEEDIMRLLGRNPTVPVWLAGGVLEEAKAMARQWICSGARPHIRIEYLEPPAREDIRCRVVSTGSGERIEYPAPGGMIFDSLEDAKRTGKCLFLGSEEEVWQVHAVRPETSPSGASYIALELVRVTRPDDRRAARIREAIERMETGIIHGKIQPYRREELHERRAP